MLATQAQVVLEEAVQAGLLETQVQAVREGAMLVDLLVILGQAVLEAAILVDPPEIPVQVVQVETLLETRALVAQAEALPETRALAGMQAQVALLSSLLVVVARPPLQSEVEVLNHRLQLLEWPLKPRNKPLALGTCS